VDNGGMRPLEWTTPEPVTRRDQVLANLVCDPPPGTGPKPAGEQDTDEQQP
jgi:hypothetical protein